MADTRGEITGLLCTSDMLSFTYGDSFKSTGIVGETPTLTLIAVISVTRHGMNVERVAIDRSQSPLSHEVVHLCKYIVLIEILTKKCSVVLDWKVGPNAGIASHTDWALLDVII